MTEVASTVTESDFKTRISDPIHLPRIFQGNVDRLFQRVILPGLDALPIHPELKFGVASSMDEFFDMAKALTDNYTANEAAKAYSLVLAALFERQLRIWASTRDDPSKKGARTVAFRTLLKDCARQADINLEEKRLGHSLTEMFLVANVFRHGDGPAAEALRQHSPGLWDYEHTRYVDTLPPNSHASERLLLQPRDVVRYAGACARFWGHSDKIPGAVHEPPYG